MCRLFAYRGRPVTLSRWLFDAPHSLERQAFAPRELVHGTVNVDGTGIVWWEETDPRPLRYISEHPPWADPNLPGLAARLTSGVQLGAVRSATPGLGFGPEHVQPLVWEHVAGAHNGRINGFRGPVGRALLESLPQETLAALSAWNDSAVLFLLAVARLRAGHSLLEAAQGALAAAVRACRAHGQGATLNLALADRERTVAARVSHEAPLNTLYTLEGDDHRGVASEPVDDAGWRPVPADHIAEITDRGLTLHRFDPESP